MSEVKLNSYCEVLNFSSFDVKDSGLLGCDSEWKGYYVPAFRRNILPSSSLVKDLFLGLVDI